MRARWIGAVLVSAVFLLVPSWSLAEGSVTITSPRPGQTVGPGPTFTGTGRVSETYSSVGVTVSGPGGFTNGAEVRADGTWEVSGPEPLGAGEHTVTACQGQDFAPDECADPVTFTVRRAAPFSVTPPKGSVQSLVDAKLSMRVACPSSCHVKARVEVSKANARRLGIPFFATHPVVGGYDDDVFNGAVRLGLPEWTKPGRYDVGSFLLSSMRLPLFKALPVSIVVHAMWSGGSADKTVAAKLRWPHVAPASGHGSHGMIGRIRGPASVSLRSNTAVFKFHLSHVTDDLLFVSLNSSGGLLHLQGKYHLHGSTTTGLGPTATYRRGVFVLKVPIAGGGSEGARNRRNARKVAPVPAFLQLAIGDKFGKGRHDTATYELVLTK